MWSQNIISLLLYTVIPFGLIFRIWLIWTWWKGGSTNGNGTIDALD